MNMQRIYIEVYMNSTISFEEIGIGNYIPHYGNKIFLIPKEHRIIVKDLDL